VEKYGRAGQATSEIWRMRITCLAPKTMKTHSEYVILIAMPLQQWLHERASVLRYTYIAFILSHPGFQLIHFRKNFHGTKWTF
jgi:hypothetical protein